jgi:hypothetical protein
MTYNSHHGHRSGSLKSSTWLLISDPSSSSLAKAWSISIACVIVLANIVFILDTHPAFYKPSGEASPIWKTMVDVCSTVVFTVEIALRVWSAPSWRSLVNIPFAVDFIVVIPAYVEFINRGNRGVRLSVLRVFRLLRVLRLFRVSRSSTVLLMSAISRSLNVLVMLIFLISIFMTVIASVMNVAERGTWDSVRREWHRETGWYCSYDVDVVGDGSYRTTLTGSTLQQVPPMCHPENAVNDTSITFRCFVNLETGYDCVPGSWDRSPFASITSSLWFVVVTMFTIGMHHILSLPHKF